MLGLWKVLGVSVVWPMALNYMFALISIVITGKISYRVLSHHFPTIKPSTISACAMLMVPLLGFLTSQNLRIQKEAGCTLGIVMVGYCLAGFAEKNNLTKNEKRRDLAVFVIGTVILALVRTNFAYFAMIGAAMMALARHHAQWKRGSLLALIALTITVVFSILFSYTFGQQYRTVDGGDAMARAFKIGIVQQPYFTLIGDYYHYPEWKRLLLLPITAGVQYIIPFPWLYDLENADIMSILPRMRVMWYFVGGTCIYYYLYINGLHYKQNNLGMWAWWPLVTFLGIAFITGGSVSRYVLPLQPLFVVIALYVLLQVKIGNYRRSATIGTPYTSKDGEVSVSRMPRALWQQHFTYTGYREHVTPELFADGSTPTTWDLTMDAGKLGTIKNVTIKQAGYFNSEEGENGTYHDGIKFVPGESAFVIPGFSTSWYFNEQISDTNDGVAVQIYTSSYADFAAMKLPTGKVNVTGVLKHYCNKKGQRDQWELIMRSLSDIEEVK